jgi:hypothetical protein
LSFYKGIGVGVLKIKQSESEVLKIEESESEVLKIEESESEVLKIEESESEVLKIEESESEVLKIEESESEVLKIEESESELLCTDCIALLLKRHFGLYSQSYKPKIPACPSNRFKIHNSRYLANVAGS